MRVRVRIRVGIRVGVRVRVRVGIRVRACKMEPISAGKLVIIAGESRPG